MADFEFERLVAYFDADVSPLAGKTKTATKLIDNLEKRIRNFKGKLDLTTGNKSSGTGSIDVQMRKAEAEIKRFQSERTRGEQAYTRTVEREARQQSTARTREQRRASNSFLADLRKINTEEKKQSARSTRTGSGVGVGSALALGGGIAAALGISTGLVSIATDGREAYVSLEKLVRFTATLDRAFQSQDGLVKFRKDIEALSIEVPQTAENIAKASFSVKSAYSKMTEPELIAFLKKLSVQATASNTTVDQHAERVIALAKAYGVTSAELDSFGAVLSTAFGDALATDSAVGEGFNKILVSARLLGQPLNEVAAAMGAIQSTSSDAERNTTNLQNVFAKLADPKYAEGMKATFGVDVFDAQGKFKGLNAIVNELAKSMDGLTDKEKSGKIGEVFKDLQAREGLLSLVGVLGQYNERLRDGADADAFAAKQETMLNSAEAKWQHFSNKIDQIKRSIGKEVTNIPSAGADQQDPAAQAQMTMKAVADTISRGVLSFTEASANNSVSLNNIILRKLGLDDPATDALLRKSIQQFFVKADGALDEATRSLQASLLSQSKLDLSAVLKNPKADAAIKAAAQVQINEINQALTRGFAEMDPIEIEKFRLLIGDKAFAGVVADVDGKLVGVLNEAALKAAEGLRSPDAQLRIKAQESITAYQNSLAATLQQTDLSPEVRSMLERAMANVPSYIATEAQKASGSATGSGQTLGQQFAQGMASGLRSGYGWVGAAVAALVDNAFASGKAAQDSNSPSRRAAEELGLPFVQGIEVGIVGRSGALANTAAAVIKSSMFGPKSKKAVAENVKKLFDDLTYELGRIDPKANASKEVTTRLFEAILGDQSRSYEDQVASVAEYYQKIYDIEEESYQKRLINIGQREDAMRRRKDIKPGEIADGLRSLGDERTDLNANREQGRSESRNARDSALGNAGGRRIELADRDFARKQMTDEIALLGVRRSAEQEAETNTRNEIARIQSRIDGYKDERMNYEIGSSEYVAWTNKIVDAEQDSADAVAKGSVDRARARQDDQKTLEDYVRSLADFSRQTVDAQFDADQAKIELLKATGAKQEEIFTAEQALAIKRENFQTSVRTAEIAGNRDSLLALATTEGQKLQIQTDANAQMEAETRRHQDMMSQLTATQGSKSILGQWRAIAAELPGYVDQFKSFAVGLPEAIGGIFSSAVQNFDGTWKSFLEGMKTAFFQTIQAMLAELFRVQLIKGLVGLFGAVAGSFGGGGGGGLAGAGAHPAFAEGGIPPMGRISMVGERGPELFVPHVAGRVLSNEDSMAALSGGGGKGGDVYNLSVNQTFKGPRGLVAPKSVKQQTRDAVDGLSYGTKGKRQTW